MHCNSVYDYNIIIRTLRTRKCYVTYSIYYSSIIILTTVVETRAVEDVGNKRRNNWVMAAHRVGECARRAPIGDSCCGLGFVEADSRTAGAIYATVVVVGRRASPVRRAAFAVVEKRAKTNSVRDVFCVLPNSINRCTTRSIPVNCNKRQSKG